MIYHKYLYVPTESKLVDVGTHAGKAAKGANMKIRWCNVKNGICVYAENPDIVTPMFHLVAEPVSLNYLYYLREIQGLYDQNVKPDRYNDIQERIDILIDFRCQILNCDLPY